MKRKATNHYHEEGHKYILRAKYGGGDLRDTLTRGQDIERLSGVMGSSASPFSSCSARVFAYLSIQLYIEVAIIF